MLLVHSSLKPSSIHGFGCFADEDIKVGQVVWIFDNRLDVRISAEALEHLPPPAQAFWRKYGYFEMFGGRKTIVMCGDHAKHMNHAAEPNLIEAGANGELNVAARDIAAGEELTCNYFNFDLEAAAKLADSRAST